MSETTMAPDSPRTSSPEGRTTLSEGSRLTSEAGWLPLRASVSVTRGLWLGLVFFGSPSTGGPAAVPTSIYADVRVQQEALPSQGASPTCIVA